MAYISHTTVALHNELAEIQDRRGKVARIR